MTLCTITGEDFLNAGAWTQPIVTNEVLGKFLPAIFFLLSLGIAFATGTSWGTFSMLLGFIIFSNTVFSTELLITISATLAGAVCGDHISPISDTTIMASAGAQCNHINHVKTQIPYALTVAGVSLICYLIAGFLPYWFVMLPLSIALMIGTLILLKILLNKRNGKQLAFTVGDTATAEEVAPVASEETENTEN